MSAGGRIVCFCSLGPPPTGQAIVSQEALRCLAAGGARVDVVPKRIVSGIGKFVDYALSLPRIIWALLAGPRPRLAYLACSRSRSGFLRDALFLALCRLRRVPVINHVHGSDLPALLRDPVLGPLARELLNGVHANVVVTAGLAAACEQAGLRNAVVIGNFAAAEFFQLDAARAGRPPPVRILFLSNVMQDKGVFDLIEACRRLPREVPFQLDVVGAVLEPTPARAARTRTELESQQARLDFVRWHGPVAAAERPRAFAAADIFCLPSLDEAAPLSLLEAMASGLPCVVTAVGGVPELVTDGDTACLVPPSQPAALTACLQRLVASADLRRQLGERARAHARRRFARERFCRELQGLADVAMAQPGA